MKYIILILFSFYTPFSKANFCSWFLEPEVQFNLTHRAESLKEKDLNEILADKSKTWVKTRNNEYRAYKFIPGRANKPLVVFIMGLGGSIEETLHKNMIVKDYIKQKYPVLILEGSKLGDTAILNDRLNNQVDFKSNMDGYEDLLSVFLQEHDFIFSSLIISGHSYGAYGASHLASKIKEIIHSHKPEIENFDLTLKLFAPAVTNFNNRLNPNWVNTVLERVSSYLDFWGTNAGYKQQVKEVRKALVASMPTLTEDPLKLKMSAELTVDAGSEHIFKILKKLDLQTEIQIYLGTNENVLFPMMHFELLESLVSRLHNVHMIHVVGADHFVTDLLTNKQSRAIANFRASRINPLNTYSILAANGTVSFANLADLKLQLQTSSLALWNEFIANQDATYVYFGPIPIRDLNSFYPTEWQP